MAAEEVVRQVFQAFADDDQLILEAVLRFMQEFPVDHVVFQEYAPWVKIFVDMDGWRRLPEATFQMHFRMSRTLFNNLLNEILQHLRMKFPTMRARGPMDLPLMMSLWILYNKDTMKNAALKFGVSPGVLFYHYAYIIEALREMAPQYIVWPTPAEREDTKRHFQEKSGYPGICGSIDRTHIEITAPKEEKQAYVNRHAYHSINVQAIVDHKLVVRDLHVGEPGSLNDCRIFRRSPVSRKLLTNPQMLSLGEHIVGDGAYGVTDKLLAPYEDNQNLNPANRAHNYSLSSCRSTVERGFCYCKSKFRRLKQFEQKEIPYTVDAITACFVVSNYNLLDGRRLPPNNVGQFDREVPDEEFEGILADAGQAGQEKRDNIAAYLFRQAGVPHN